MIKFKIGKIKTSYSNESYFFLFDQGKKYRDTEITIDEESQLQAFMASICFCDDFEIIAIEEADEDKILLFNSAVEEIRKNNIEVDDFWFVRSCLFASGYYETIEELIAQ